MSKKSLASVLKLQWWIHTFLTSLFFIAVTFFFLFSMEDYFHEKHLIEMSNLVTVNESIKGMPAHIQLYSVAEAPTDWLSQLEQVELNDAIEIDNVQGGASHLVRSQFSESKETFVLALDTSKTNSIWDIADKLLMLILPWMVIFLAIASFLAKKFIRQLQDHFKRLLTTIKQSESADTLEQFSETQTISELAQFAQLFAQVWQQKVDIMTREKQVLEYLSHELRTPIQSSLATLELLALKTEDKKIIKRLTRSLNRMTRLSNSILFLMEAKQLPPTYQVDIIKICLHLVAELTPLADIKKQRILINYLDPQTDEIKLIEGEACYLKTTITTTTSPCNIVATQEVVEALLSILLTNALQHSNNSPIIITLSHEGVCIENEIKLPQKADDINSHLQGFGLGLTIAQRLADKFTLDFNINFDEKSKVKATIGGSNI